MSNFAERQQELAAVGFELSQVQSELARLPDDTQLAELRVLANANDGARSVMARAQLNSVDTDRRRDLQRDLAKLQKKRAALEADEQHAQQQDLQRAAEARERRAEIEEKYHLAQLQHEVDRLQLPYLKLEHARLAIEMELSGLSQGGLFLVYQGKRDELKRRIDALEGDAV